MKNNYQASEMPCTKCVLQHIAKRGYLAILFVIFFTNVFSQIPLPNGKIPGGLVNGGGNGNNSKWSFYGDNISENYRLGSLNGYSLVFTTNNVDKVWLTPEGLLGVGIFPTQMCDVNGSIFARGSLMANENLWFGGNDVNKISANSGNLNIVRTKLGIGLTSNPAALLDVGGDAIVRGFLFVEQGVIIGKKIKSEKVITDTLTTSKMELQEMLADSVTALRMVSETMQVAEMKASDYVEVANNININGTASKITSGSGFIDFDNDHIITTGRVAAGQLSATTMNISGTTTLHRIVTDRIVSPDTVICMGDSTLMYTPNSNRIEGGSEWNATYKGLGLGAQTYAYGLHSTAIGYRVSATTNTSIMLGCGSDYSPTIVNDIPNSLLVGFNVGTGNINALFAGISGYGKARVGIGTKQPDQNSILHVVDNSVETIVHFQNSAGGSSIMKLKIGEGTPESQWGEISHYGSDNSFRIRNVTGNNSTRGNLLLNWDGGNVGIGTTTPMASLHIKGENGLLSLEGSSHSYMQFYPDGYSSGRKGWFGFGSGANDNITISNESSGGNILLMSNGNVGIGTTTPDYKLDVCGTIRSQEFVVEAIGCDFVFDDNYKRMTFDEKEKWFKEKKHLQGILPASEIEKEGMKVGATVPGIIMNVEENSLDIIDLYKQLLALKKENEELKARISVIESEK